MGQLEDMINVAPRFVAVGPALSYTVCAATHSLLRQQKLLQTHKDTKQLFYTTTNSFCS